MAEENIALYRWNFEDKKDRSALWYIIALSVVVWMVIWGFITKQYGMSFLFMLLAGIVFYVENNSEDEISVQVTNLWMRVGEKFYDFSRITSFAFMYDGDQCIYLKLRIRQQGIPVIQLKVNNTITSELRPILAQYIEENPKEELSFLDRLVHILKL